MKTLKHKTLTAEHAENAEHSREELKYIEIILKFIETYRNSLKLIVSLLRQLISTNFYLFLYLYFQSLRTLRPLRFNKVLDFIRLIRVISVLGFAAQASDYVFAEG